MSYDAQSLFPAHPTEEILEEYAFGRIYEPQLGHLEEHLLSCPECQGSLLAIDEYVTFMKAGLAALEKAPDSAPLGSRAINSPGRPTPLNRKRGLRGPLPPELPIFEDPRSGLRQSTPSPTDAPLPALANAERCPRAASWFPLGFPQMRASQMLSTSALLFVVLGAIAWRFQSAELTTPPTTVKLIALRGGDGGIARGPYGRPLDLVMDVTGLRPDIAYRAEVVGSTGTQIWNGRVRPADQNLSAQIPALPRAGIYWVRLYSSGGQLLREFGLHIE